MPLSHELAVWLRNEGHDAVHATDLDLSRAADVDVMAYAKREGRTVVTADLDYPRLLAVARASNPSLILFRDGNWSDASVVVRMREILRALNEADVSESIVVVDRDRVRRRRLPIE